MRRGRPTGSLPRRPGNSSSRSGSGNFSRRTVRKRHSLFRGALEISFRGQLPGLPAALYPCAVSGLPRKPENGFSRRAPARIKSKSGRGRPAVFRGDPETASHAATWLELRASQVADGQQSSVEIRKSVVAIRKRELPAAHGARMA